MRIGVGTGISKDVRRRLPLYADDWKRGMSVGLHIFAPATYIFFASFLPALAFGEQFREETTGLFSIPHILCATAIAGVLQSCVGGQPVLIVGVAEPIVLTYYYIFKYAEPIRRRRRALRPFCAWVLIFTALMHVCSRSSTPASTSTRSRVSAARPSALSSPCSSYRRP